MKKLLAVVLAFAMVLSFGALAFAATSETAADVEAVNAPVGAPAGGAPAGGAAAPVEKDYTKILDANNEETEESAADAVEDADTAIARLEAEDADLAEAVKAFFEENAENVGQGVVNVSDEALEKIPTDEFGVPVKAKGVTKGETVTVILLFPNGSSVTLQLTAPVDEIVVLPISKDAAKNVAYVILK
ncbi:MAG: hypothetical protein J6M64_03330 [Oscillospiraceae bacterium]|nr:hypothetical protein [Oscillospiraceae bacterium]